MKPDEWIRGMANEAACVEDARWARETKYAAWREHWRYDEDNYFKGRITGKNGQAVKWGIVGLVSLPLVAFYGAVLEQMGWTLLTGTSFCAGSLAGVGSLALACGHVRWPVWVRVALGLLSVILLGHFFGSGRMVMPVTAEFLLMGLVMLGAYAAYFYSLGRRWLGSDLVES